MSVLVFETLNASTHRLACPSADSEPLSSALHRPERFSKTDLLACLQIKGKIPWSFEQQYNSGAQVELAQVLSFSHAHAFLVVVCYVAEIVVSSFVVPRVVGTELLRRKSSLLMSMH